MWKIHHYLPTELWSLGLRKSLFLCTIYCFLVWLPPPLFFPLFRSWPYFYFGRCLPGIYFKTFWVFCFRYVSCIKHKIGFYFVIQSGNLSFNTYIYFIDIQISLIFIPLYYFMYPVLAIFKMSLTEWLVFFAHAYCLCVFFSDIKKGLRFCFF